MINLLSPQADKTLTREYWLRILTVWGFLLSGLCLTLSLLLIPTYVLIHTQLVAITVEKQKNEEIESKFKTAETDIVNANALVTAFAQPTSQVTMTGILDAIYTARVPSTEYKTILFERKAGVVETVQLQGQANTRTDLIALKTNLERSPFFENVTVPLSDLARDIDLPFAITLSLTSITK